MSSRTRNDLSDLCPVLCFVLLHMCLPCPSFSLYAPLPPVYFPIFESLFVFPSFSLRHGIAARSVALAHLDLPFVEYAREFCGLATRTTFGDATINSLFWHGANYHRPVDLPDTTGLCWREGILRCLESILPWTRTSPPSSPSAVPQSSLSADPPVKPAIRRWLKPAFHSAAHSSPPSVAHSSPQLSAATSLTVNQKRNMRRKRLWSPAPEFALVPAPPERHPDPESGPGRASESSTFPKYFLVGVLGKARQGTASLFI